MATTAVVLRRVRAEDCTACVVLTCQTTPVLSYKEPAAKTQTEEGERGQCCQNQPLSHVTYSGACTQPCSTPLSRNCCGCRHSPRI